jgi:hypothetical protein
MSTATNTKMKTERKEVFLVGDIKYTGSARALSHNKSWDWVDDFLIQLQSLMEEFEVVKVDVAWDALKMKRELENFNTNENETNSSRVANYSFTKKRH